MMQSGIQAKFKQRYQKLRHSSFALDVNLDLPGRGVTGIFGPSGSGKTTLLRCIAGLQKAEQGNLRVNGEVWQNEKQTLPTHKRSLAYVFQESSLFPHLSVKANLDFAVKRAATVDTAFYKHILELMDIARLCERMPEHLSGGERQRVAIARAFLVRPRLLLMDEPLASLDVGRKQEILPYLERLHEEFDLPVLYVSHALDEIARLADHLVVMDQGQVVADGKLTEVLSRTDLPIQWGDDAGVVLPAQVVERDQQWHLLRVEFPGGSLWVRDGGDELGQTVRIRVLARDISLALSSHDDSSILNRLPVTVLDLKTGRDEAMVLVRLASGDSILIARITQRSLAHLELEAGKSLWAQIKSVAVVR
jgi:molybdate transport system ATP-binding protein